MPLLGSIVNIATRDITHLVADYSHKYGKAFTVGPLARSCFGPTLPCHAKYRTVWHVALGRIYALNALEAAGGWSQVVCMVDG